MHVASSPIEAPVALIEKPGQGGRSCIRVLVFKEGLLPAPVILLLSRLLEHV